MNKFRSQLIVSLLFILLFLLGTLSVYSKYQPNKSIGTNQFQKTIFQDKFFAIKSISLSASNYNGQFYKEKNGVPIYPEQPFDTTTDIKIEISISQLSKIKVKNLNIEELTIFSDSKTVKIDPVKVKKERRKITIIAKVPEKNFLLAEAVFAKFKLTTKDYSSQEIKTPWTSVVIGKKAL